MAECSSCNKEIDNSMSRCIHCGNIIIPKEDILGDMGKTLAEGFDGLLFKNKTTPPIRKEVQKKASNNLGPMPDELRTWNWGAFSFPLLWGIFNNTPEAFFCMIPIFGIVKQIELLKNGNELAWKNKEWESIEQFKKAQEKWADWAVLTFVAGIVMAVTFVSIGSLVFENNDVCKASFHQIQKNNEMIESIGSPIKRCSSVFGRIRPNGRAELNYSIKGPKGSAKVEVEGEKSSGKVSVNKIKVVLDKQNKIISIPAFEEKKS